MGKVFKSAVNASTLGLSSGKFDPVGSVKSAVTAASLGTIDMTKEKKKASTIAAAALASDMATDIKKRKALYGTQGGVLGQEVEEVGNSSRGNIFGN